MSLERFQRYVDWADGNKEQAFTLYALNLQLSEALYTPLHMLEISLRNQFHRVLSAHFGENWFEKSEFFYLRYQKEQVAKAKADLEARQKNFTAGDMVSALTFGFWTGFLSPHYENLWQQTLHYAAHREDGKGLTRKALITPLTPIRNL